MIQVIKNIISQWSEFEKMLAKLKALQKADQQRTEEIVKNIDRICKLSGRTRLEVVSGMIQKAAAGKKQ